jgi:vacuolar-type H+-ATPase subunit I/STV1
MQSALYTINLDWNILTKQGDGHMTEETSGNINQAEKIQIQLNQALKELDQIRNIRQSITDQDGLQAVERSILQETDKIAALMTALKIQQAVDSDELREKSDELVQAVPEKLKNQGRRLVSIQTSRGAAIKVAAPYYSRKKKKDKRRKKKKK